MCWQLLGGVEGSLGAALEDLGGSAHVSLRVGLGQEAHAPSVTAVPAVTPPRLLEELCVCSTPPFLWNGRAVAVPHLLWRVIWTPDVHLWSSGSFW